MVPVIAYKSKKTKEIAIKNIEKCCNSIVKEYDISQELLLKVSGSICYSSLFLIPEFDLIDGRTYSIENICYYIIGIKTLSFHDILLAFANISLGKDIKENLEIILSDCMFPEVIYDLGLSCKDVYCALMLCYLNITNKSLLKDVYSLYFTPSCSYHTLSSYFEREVFPKWKI